MIIKVLYKKETHVMVLDEADFSSLLTKIRSSFSSFLRILCYLIWILKGIESQLLMPAIWVLSSLFQTKRPSDWKLMSLNQEIEISTNKKVIISIRNFLLMIKVLQTLKRTIFNVFLRPFYSKNGERSLSMRR